MKKKKKENWIPSNNNTDVNYAVGMELPIKGMAISFMPSWWHKVHGIEYGEKYVFDPDYRVETVRYKWSQIHKKYPDLNVGEADPAPRVIPADFHNSLGPAAVGCEVVFPIDNYPLSKPAGDDIAFEKLKVPDEIENSFPYNDMIRQVKYLNGKLGFDRIPFLFKNGILNDAYLMRGDELLLDIMDDNDYYRKAMDLSLQLGYRVFSYDIGQKSIPEIMPLCNCTLKLISPALYEKCQLEYDIKIADFLTENGTKIMIHYCGVADPFINGFKKWCKPAMIQVGQWSDVRLVLDSFPDAAVDYCYTSSWLISATTEDVREFTRQLMENSTGDWHRLSISVGDMDITTPEDHVMTIYETIMQY